MAKITIEISGISAAYSVNDTLLRKVLDDIAESEGLEEASEQERVAWLAEVVLPRALNSDVARSVQGRAREKERQAMRESREARHEARSNRRESTRI